MNPLLPSMTVAVVDDFWKVRIPPPLWYAAGVLVGVTLDVAAVDFDVAVWAPVRVGLALLLTAAFGFLAPRAILLFRQTGQDAKPWTPATQVLASGPYRFTRNPMYVGLACLQLAIGVALANGWILVAVPVVLGAVYLTAVRFEEAYLESEFGQVYLDYKQSVRRWL